MCGRIARRAALSAVTALGIMLMGGAIASAASSQSAKNSASEKWELQGSRIIGCCCASPCPCRINKPPMYAHGCDATTAVHIDKGTLGGTRMDGVTFILTGRGFGENVEGNWGYLYVSDKATDAQVKALQGMFEAQAQAWGAKTPYLAGKFLGMRQVPMTYEISADRQVYSATIPGILELRTRAIVLPGRTKPAVSTGIFDAFGDRFIHAEALVHTYKDPQINHEWDLTGRQCNHTDFKLTSAMAAKGGVGWGCWSAHAGLGSKDKYQEQIIQDTKHEKE